MIRLTLLNGKHWYVNPDHIVGIKSGHKYGAAIESDHQTGIEHTIDVTQVQESPQEVARKVLEWQYFYERFKAFARAWAAQIDEKVSLTMYDGMESAREELRRLAGLEDMNHDAG